MKNTTAMKILARRGLGTTDSFPNLRYPGEIVIRFKPEVAILYSGGGKSHLEQLRKYRDLNRQGKLTI